MILTRFEARIYVRVDREYRADIWTSGSWEKPEECLDEMVEEIDDTLCALSSNSSNYDGYVAGEDPECDDDHYFCNKDYRDRYLEMIDEVRKTMPEELASGSWIEKNFDDVDIIIEPKSIHIPEITEYEWAKICESKAL